MEIETSLVLVRDHVYESLRACRSSNGRKGGEISVEVVWLVGSAYTADLFCKRVDLFSDSMGVVAVSKNPVLSSATKHIEIADFFVRELVQNKIVTVSFVRTAVMVADVLTKALGADKFFRFMGIIFGVLRPEDATDSTSPLSVFKSPSVIANIRLRRMASRFLGLKSPSVIAGLRLRRMASQFICGLKSPSVIAGLRLRRMASRLIFGLKSPSVIADVWLRRMASLFRLKSPSVIAGRMASLFLFRLQSPFVIALEELRRMASH